MSIIPSTAITIDGTTAWLVGPDYTPAFIATLNRPCDTCDTYDGLGCIGFPDGYDDPCPDCHGTGRHTFTLDVPCLCMTLPGCNGPYKGGPCGGTGTRHIAVHVVEVMPIVAWDTVDLGLPHPVPCMTVDPHGNGLEVTERDAHDYFGINRATPTDTDPGMFAVRLEIHKAQA
jgi:hypothetical protein